MRYGFKDLSCIESETFTARGGGAAPPFRAVRRPRYAAAADVLLYTYKLRTFIPGMNPELAKMLSSMERARA